MKNQHAGWFVPFLVVFPFLIVAASAKAALPFTVKGGHPRVYVDSTRVNEIRAAIQKKDQAFNGESFPQTAGTLTFDLFVPPPPSSPTLWPQTVAGFWANSGIFDDWDSTRNHIYISHFDRNDDPKGPPHYHCGVSNINQAAIRIAFQQQSNDAASSRFYSPTPCIRTNTWVSITVYWDTSTPILGYAISGECMSDCAGFTNSMPSGWTPKDQRFRFTGRSGYNNTTGLNDIADRLDNIRLYSSATPSSSNLLVSFPLNEGVGVYATDVSGHGHAGRLEAEVKWVTRSDPSLNYAIEISGSIYPFSAIAESPMVDAWSGFKKLADQYANEFNNCSGRINYDPVNNIFIYYDSVTNSNKICALSNNPATGHEGVPRNYARTLGLAWLLTSDPKFSSAALKYADLLIDIPADKGHDLVRATRVEAMGLLYDYLNDVGDMRNKHNQFVQKVREAVARYDSDGITPSSVNPTLCGPNYYFTLRDNLCRYQYQTYPGGPPETLLGPNLRIGHAHNYGVNAALSTGILGLLDAPDADLESVLYMTHLNFVNGFNPARAWIAVDGGFHKSWLYSATYTNLSHILAWNTATNLNMTADWQSKLIYMYLYALRGDFVYPSGGSGGGRVDAKLFAWWSSLNAADGYAQRFYRRWLMPTISEPFFDLVLGRSGLSESPIEDLPYSRLFRNAGRVLIRDTWDYPNATLMEFKSASFAHQGEHMDQNAFSIFYKAPLLVDSGYYDNYNSPHFLNYYQRGIAHNLVTVWDSAECFSPLYPTGYGCASNDGGQRYFLNTEASLADIQEGGSDHLDGVTAYEYRPDFTYTVGNASKAYKGTKLDQTNGFIRSLLFLRAPPWNKNKPVTVVFDKVTASSSLTKRFLLHTVNEPRAPGGSAVGPGIHSLLGSTIEVRNGGGMLFSQTLLPVDPVLTVIGGKTMTNDFRFLVPSNTAPDYQSGFVNYPPSPDPDSSATDSVVSADMGAWRVEVTAPSPSAREYFLHVLSVADNSAVSAPPSAQNLSSATAAVAFVGGDQVIVFSKADRPVDALSWNMPLTDAKLIITGLVPNAAYAGSINTTGSTHTASLDRNQNGPLIASSQGVLVTTSSGFSRGIDLAVTLTATAPIPALVNDTVTYTVTVTNKGPATASAVRLTDTLPSGLSAVSVSPTQACTMGQTITCILGVLANGASATVTIIAKATTAGSKTNTAIVSNAEADPIITNNTASASTTVLGNCVSTNGPKLSGKVTHSRNGRAVSGVILNLIRTDSTCGNRTATASDGTYQFTRLPRATYTVTPSKIGCAGFTPANRTVTIGSSNKTNQNFTGGCL